MTARGFDTLEVAAFPTLAVTWPLGVKRGLGLAPAFAGPQVSTLHGGLRRVITSV